MSGYAECSVDQCHARVEAKGWCNPHYQKWVKHGDPTYERPSRTERFWMRVNKNGPVPERRPDLGPCWLWIGGRHTGGYGSDGGRLAHRVAYELITGSIPIGLQLDHLCHVRLCVRPEHLEPVPARENIIRSDAPNAIAVRTGRCARGHELTGTNLYIVPRTGDRRCLACVAIRKGRSA